MIKLIDEKLLRPFKVLLIADIPPDFRCANRLSRCIADWRYGDRNVNAATILCNAHSFEMIDMFPFLKAREDVILFGSEFHGNDARDVLTDHLLGRIAKDAFGARIPCRNVSIERFADDGVIRRSNDRGKSRGLQLALARVLDAADGADQFTVGGKYRIDANIDCNAVTVWPLENQFGGFDWLAGLQRNRHRVVRLRQRLAIRAVYLAGFTELGITGCGLHAPELDAPLIELDQRPILRAGENAHRHGMTERAQFELLRMREILR